MRCEGCTVTKSLPQDLSTSGNTTVATAEIGVTIEGVDDSKNRHQVAFMSAQGWKMESCENLESRQQNRAVLNKEHP